MSPRDHVRKLIQTEIAAADPIEDARRSLELIAETSVRHSSTEGVDTVVIVDDAGCPRVIDRGGEKVAMTLPDLVEELREKHPTLFKHREARPAPVPAADPTLQAPREPQTAAEADPPTEPAVAPAKAKAERDWLRLGAAAQAPTVPSRSISRSFSPAVQKMRVVRRLGEGSGSVRMHLRAKGGGATTPMIPRMPEGRFTIEENRPEASGFFARPLRRGLALGAAFALVLLSCIAAFSLLPLRKDRTFADAPSSPPATLATAQDPSGTSSLPAGEKTEKTAGAENPLPSPALLRGVADVLDTATLYVEGKVVPLFGVEWARGAGDPDDLSRYLRGREVTCRSVSSPESYHCEVEGLDLSRVVLFNGGGRARSNATPELKAAEDMARSARRGVWASEAGSQKP
jgi:hypothetical protein